MSCVVWTMCLSSNAAPKFEFFGLFKVCYFTINRQTEKFFACQVVWLTDSLIADLKKNNLEAVFWIA